MDRRKRKGKQLEQEKEKQIRSIQTSFWAGAAAGTAVDVGLFPLDTLKTRLQSQFGFWKSGGFRGIYNGVGPTAIGAAPTAALFFASYSGFKQVIEPRITKSQDKEFIVRMFAAAFAEAVSCITRVPTDVVKQRRQACANETSSIRIITSTLRREGVFGLYRGFWVTVLRDAPFSVIQYPLWEYLKERFHQQTPAQGALCGAAAGAFAGAVTTPLDVIKTRIMLEQGCFSKESKTSSWTVIKHIFKESGIKGFFAGFLPRTLWIFLGGGVYFGVYEETANYIDGF